MNGHDGGIYTLQVYASVAGLSAPDVLSSFTSKYGDDEVTSLGNLSSGANIQAAMSEVAKGNMNANPPSRVDLNQALLDNGGGSSGGIGAIVKAVEGGVSDSVTQAVSFSTSTLKWLAIAALAIGAGYLALELGWFKHAAHKLRAK